MFFPSDSRTSASKSLFSADSQVSTQNNMDELLDLCSGRFTGINPSQHDTGHSTQTIRHGLQAGTGPFIISTEDNSNRLVQYS
jgi:hypothetical protein